MTLTRSKISQQITIETGIPKKEVALIVQRVFAVMTEELQSGGKIELRNFGVFDIRHEAARLGRNPRHPEQTIVVPAWESVRFRPGKRLKQAVRKS